MSVFKARYFDGQRSVAHEVSVVLGGGALKIVGRDVELRRLAQVHEDHIGLVHV